MTDKTQKTKRKRVLSGMRPTGRLHIGHYFGALSNWLKMQEEYDCYFFVADWHALTTHYADSSQVASNTLEVATDWLAVGLDPAKATLFIQSSVPEHAELHLLLSMITPLSWLERVPTYKEQIENLRDKDLGTYGFLGYPLLQGADIVMYGEPGCELLVPVGEDQAPHIEMTREIVRRFNTLFGLGFARKPTLDELREIFERGRVSSLPIVTEVISTEPEQLSLFLSLIRRRALEVGRENFLDSLGELRELFFVTDVLQQPDVILTETPRVPGTDGRRMAKSYGNGIWLSDTPEEIRKKAHNMMTDPQRVRRTDPGRPEVCPVFAYHNLFPVEKSAEDRARIERVDRECRTAEIGCVDCKKLMADALVKWIEPVQARRREYEANPQRVWGILEDGSKRAKRVAEQTMERVRKAVFNWEAAGRPGATIGAGKGKVAAEK
ncbi:MAG TPA: tryptophan--tRNA ligase [Candidatus Acidoferrales bacterium]|nr:tryptophan--tRNA ligase [Candidatus Acidoferrales bacterium]